MPVVSNTSPLLNLAIVDRLILVKQQFGKIVIPNEVLTELKINENLPGSQQLREAIAKKWITVRQVEDRTLGLNVTGVLGIILKGWHEGQVESVRELIERLRTSANFRISHSLERQILLETGELS